MKILIKPTIQKITLLVAATLTGLSAGAQTLYVDSVAAVNSRPGMNIGAHYDLGPNFTWCDPANIRWIQDVHVTDNSGNDKSIFGFPATFVDPLPGQNIGNDYNGNAQTGDTLPWYDVTRNQAALTGAFQRGAGAYFEDGPGGPGFNNSAPIRVDFNTLVVCTDPNNKTFTAMGGFSWGFIIDPKNSNPQLLGVSAINGDGLINQFNSLIQTNKSIDGNNTMFEQWRMVTAGVGCELNVSIVPEPSSTAMFAVSGLLFVVYSRRPKTT